MYIEDSEVANAGDNAIDFVAVQYGHVCRTKVHDANWCFYVKGVSACMSMKKSRQGVQGFATVPCSS